MLGPSLRMRKKLEYPSPPLGVHPLDNSWASGEERFAALFDTASEREFRIWELTMFLDILIEG